MCASENAVQRGGVWWLCRSTHEDLESNAQILGGDEKKKKSAALREVRTPDLELTKRALYH